MSNLSVFTFENQQVRFVGTAEKPEWVAQDVCGVLGIKRTSDAINSFDEDEKGTVIIRTPGGEQQMLTVTEPGLYRLIFKSRKTVAKRFQRWVFHEVLPSIRKTGSYTLRQPELEKLKLELELIRAKQRYQDSAQAILASSSPAMLAYLRGDSLPPVRVEYRDRFIDTTTGKAIEHQDGRSLTKLIADAGLNPKSSKDRQRVKDILRARGLDYDKGKGWTTTAYLRSYKVLSDDVYDSALKTVLSELTTSHEQQNLFVYHFQHHQ
jgi:prophage antirepressor-like protein